jgi:hypothetical protein
LYIHFLHELKDSTWSTRNRVCVVATQEQAQDAETANWLSHRRKGKARKKYMGPEIFAGKERPKKPVTVTRVKQQPH